MGLTTPSSEIDDIFSRKAKPTILKSNQHSASDKKQKRQKKKRTETQTPAPEIVLDPSLQQPHASETTRQGRPVPPKKKRKLVETKPDQDKFRDSRGTGPRKRVLCQSSTISFAEPQPLAGRKTDDGFAIYKEDELGIDEEAGGQFNPTLCEFIHISLGTPLCPFDCNCCKFHPSFPPGNK